MGANRGHQLLHADALSAELEALGLDASLFGAALIPAPSFLNLVPRRGGVWDTLPNTFGFADFSSAFTRASDGLYRDSSGIWQTAGSNVLRPDHDALGNFLGLLFEPESVNKCTNFNAVPDVALTNISKAGDAAATLTRADETNAIAAIGLGNICTSGLMLFLDNSGGSADAWIDFGGTCGNTNTHTASAFVRGSGDFQLSIDGNVSPLSETLASEYIRHVLTGTPDSSARKLRFRIAAGASGYVGLNQLEEHPVATSPIVTTGASATRAKDSLAFPRTAVDGTAFVNNTEGMIAVLWRPVFATADLPASVVTGLLCSLDADNFVRWQQSAAGVARFSIYDGANDVSVDVAGGYAAGALHLMLAYWSGSSMMIGYKRGGTVTWRGSAGTYDGAFTATGDLNVSATAGSPPEHIAGVYLWNRNEGAAFLEELFTDVAE